MRARSTTASAAQHHQARAEHHADREMGLPLWQPPRGTCYLATYGASRASARAAAELLGLA